MSRLPLRIDAERFLHTIEQMAQIGLLPPEAGGGRDRRPFSAADRAARAYFQELAAQSGLDVRLDGAGNLSARLACTGSDSSAAGTLLIGSHLDTVPNGGAYDGALGVLAGLEVLRCLQASELPRSLHVEVVNFTDEEGRIGNFTGSRALAGQLPEASAQAFLQALVEGDGGSSADRAALDGQIPGGLSAGGMLGARRGPEELAGFLELHIEQGPRLEQAEAQIGVATAIFGRREVHFTFLGRADHAGTTPMGLRADALVAAARFVAAVPERIHGEFPEAVVTCGNLAVAPGVANVVPRQVTGWVEFRAASDGELSGIDRSLRALAAEVTDGKGLHFFAKPKTQNRPVPLDRSMQAVVRQAAEELGYGQMDLPSGALHDAGILAPHIPAGLIFVPSHRGRSHSPDEFTRPGDLVAGANVLLHAVARLVAASPAYSSLAAASGATDS